jgi:hypothetical protein
MACTSITTNQSLKQYLITPTSSIHITPNTNTKITNLLKQTPKTVHEKQKILLPPPPHTHTYIYIKENVFKEKKLK